MKPTLKNLPHKLQLFLLIFSISTVAVSQTQINSLSQLWDIIDQDNVNVVMTPGTYKIGPDEVAGIEPVNGDGTIFRFTGSNSTYDFTGVTFEFDTQVFLEFGNINVTEIYLTGDNIVLKNLTMVDIGDNRPYRTALGINLSGNDNRLEGVHMTVRGSAPYGYGDMFGKGTGYIVKHFKHSAILIRGNRNHVKDCTIIHRAYGHGIFCQGSVDALIEGVYLEGEIRTTDEVLAEAGTGSAADEVDFMTDWGFKLTPGWAFSLQEDGIRAYNRGTDPETGIETNTKNMIVRDCVIKNMRAGVTIGFCDDEKYVENCTAIGCENGFWVGPGDVVNSRGDASVGPLFSSQYGTDKNANIDLTLIDGDDPYYGRHSMMYIGGNNHDISLKDETTSFDPNLKIQIAGIREGMRWEEGTEFDEIWYDQEGDDIELINKTNYPVIIGNKGRDLDIESCGEVTDNGSGNTITTPNDCDDSAPDVTTVIINGEEVEATLLFREEFNNNLSNWVVETDQSVGSVAIDDGKLDIEVDSGCVVWYKEWLEGPIMIEFDAVPIDQGGQLDNVSDLNSFILASDLDGNPADFFNESEERGSSGAHLGLYDPFGMYYVGHGGGSNSRTRFRRYDGEGGRPLLSEHHLEDEEYLLKANENHHIKIIVYGNTFQYYVNDLLVYNWEDPNEPPYSEGYYGFRTINTHWELDNYEFYSLNDDGINDPSDPSECSLPWSDDDFQISDATYTYKSGAIDVSCISAVDISFDVEGVGNMEDADYINMYYTIDGNQQTIATKVNAFAKESFSISDISGDTIELSIEGATSHFSEIYTVSNIEIVESEGSTSTGGTTVVHMSKRNAIGFAIDGNKGGENGQNVYLWSSDTNNKNQMWNEIDRGNGYYSYQKYGTNFCIDGNNGGEDGQSVYLWECRDNNQNQHWEKISVGSGAYKLIKRNAGGFALDGGSGGDDGQDLIMSDSSSNSQDLHWVFNSVKSSDIDVEKSESSMGLYPVPFTDVLNITLDEGIESGRIDVISATGKVVFSNSISNKSSETLNLSHLSRGLYIVKVTSVKYVTVGRVIKQ